MKTLNDIFSNAREFNAFNEVVAVIPDSMGYVTATRGEAWTNSRLEAVINVVGLSNAVPFKQLSVVGE